MKKKEQIEKIKTFDVFNSVILHFCIPKNPYIWR